MHARHWRRDHRPGSSQPFIRPPVPRHGPMTQPVVLHVNTARGWRGGERQVLLLTERLHALGVRSIVASPSDQPLAAAVTQRGLPFVPFAPRGEWDISAIRALRRAARANNVTVLN